MDIKLKEMIYDTTIEGIMKIYGKDETTSREIVRDSGIDWSIEVAPEMVAHCSQEQLVDMVMG